MKWQKSRLLELAREFQPVITLVEERVNKSSQSSSSQKSATSTSEAPSTSNFPDDPASMSDAEILLAAAEILYESEVPVETVVTTVDQFVEAGKASKEPSSVVDRSSEKLSPSAADPETVIEGWQKSWDDTSHGIAAANMRWLKDSEDHGLFKPSKPYLSTKGVLTERKVFKDQLQFNPPPDPTAIKSLIPNMLAFFTTTVFFWRPVGVINAKIKCPNASCPAPADTYLVKHGFGSSPRQVCGLKFYFTLLSEHLICYHCRRRRQTEANSQESDTDKLQYSWHAYSPQIMMRLAPAIRSMFPAVLCGNRTIGKDIVTLLHDRLNAVSMTKVQRLVKNGHSEWYAERRDLYQTMLYEVHTAQKGIIPFVKPSGSYTPPIPQPSLPSARTLRRAHLIMEMEKMPDYRASILSNTGEILCIDGTKQIFKIYGEGQGTMQYVTSILNEWGQFLTTVVVAAESEGCYQRMARGLISRFRRANVPAPKVLYTDTNCCRDGTQSFLELLFSDWVQEGMVIRLDIRHWLHRWDAVVTKQTHVKYGAFMSAMSGAVLAYNKDDVMMLVKAVRSGNVDMYKKYTDEQMIAFLKPYQLKSYVRRVNRGIEETASAVEHILNDFKGPAGLDIDGIHLFKSPEAVNYHWANASRHISCMQDPPGIHLYVATKTVTINGVQLNKYRCRRGSNALEGLHSHMVNAIPSQRCAIIPFQVYLISFAMQWNIRMEALRVAGGHGRQTSCVNPQQIQRLNQQAEVLFGKEHLFEPNFVAPMPYPNQYDHPQEEELLGVEYAQCQSTFSSTDYYIKQIEEKQAEEESEEEDDVSEDEGVELDTDSEDPTDDINESFAVLTSSERVTEQESPALQDVLMTSSSLHLPGLKEVENLAVELLALADDTDKHLISKGTRHKIMSAAKLLHEHDKCIRKFVRQYESKWGYTLFGRCLGQESSQNSAAQKTKLATRYGHPAVQVTEDSRLLYLIIKMLRNRPLASSHMSPVKIVGMIKGQYKRIVDRVHDDPILAGLELPLPNINAKSVSTFLSKQEKKYNYSATAQPKTTPHQNVLSTAALPDAPSLPNTLSVSRPEVQYKPTSHVYGDRKGAKRRLELEEPEPIKVVRTTKTPTPITTTRTNLATAASILLVTPSQPATSSIMFTGSQLLPVPAPPPTTFTPLMPNKSRKPCGACKIPFCGGLRKRYKPANMNKIYTYCPTAKMSTTPGFGDVVYETFEEFKLHVDNKLKSVE